MHKNKLNKFWSFSNKKDEPSIGELMLYGEISNSTWWGDEVTPKQFKQELDALGDITQLNIYVNSGGGDVFAGQAMHSMLKRHKATKTAYVDGIAASIASVIIMAADKIVMPKNSMLMVHKAWTIAMGNADDMRKLADDMDKVDESIVAAYEERTGKTKEEILAIMEAETWMTAQEAVDNGFADEIEETKQIAASFDGAFLMLNNQQIDLSQYRNAPKFIELNNSIELNRETTQPVSNTPQLQTQLQEQQKHFNKLKSKLLEV